MLYYTILLGSLYRRSINFHYKVKQNKEFLALHTNLCFINELYPLKHNTLY